MSNWKKNKTLIKMADNYDHKISYTLLQLVAWLGGNEGARASPLTWKVCKIACFLRMIFGLKTKIAPPSKGNWGETR